MGVNSVCLSLNHHHYLELFHDLNFRLRVESVVVNLFENKFVCIHFMHRWYMDEEEENLELRWCSGVIEEVSDGTWTIPSKSKRRKCYTEGEAAKVYWDAIPDAIQRLEDQLSLFLKTNGIRMMWVPGEWTWTR